ncbi:MAG: protease modulator HflC [Alphaproteobacteria bacterium]
MQRPILIGIVVVIVLLAGTALSAIFTVHQTKQALILRFGEARRVITEPGLNWKVPLADTAVLLDRRILDLDSPSLEVIAADQKRLVVDAFARYRISNPLKFYQTVGNQRVANSRLSTLLNSGVRRVLGGSSFQAIVRDNRAQLIRDIASQVNVEAQKLGITIVDVRIRRADLPAANSQAVYRRMQTERQREAAEFRARGQEQSQRVRSRADRDVVILEAEATRDGEKIRGEGDAKRNAIFAKSFGKDPEFFAFYRSMQAYETGLKAGNTRLILSPDSTFFRYFQNSTGNPPTAVQ